MNTKTHACSSSCLSCSWLSGTAILEDNIFQEKLLPTDSLFGEKRGAVRAEMHLPLRYRIKGIHHNSIPVESLDISNTGIRLSLHKSVSVGTRVQLDIQLPEHKKPVHIDGIVVWVAGTAQSDSLVECGIGFENLRKLTKKEKLVYFMADRLCQIVLNYTPRQLECHPVETFEELKAAFKLIYKEYFVRGYCEYHASQMHYSLFCVLPESRTFVLRHHQQLLGTISLIVDSPCGLPLESVFGDHVQRLRNQGRRVGEVSLLALDQNAFRKGSFSLTDFHKLTGSFSLFKVLFDYARRIAGLTDLLIAVHPKHEDLYRYLAFRPLASVAPYASARGKPALPMQLEISEVKDQLPPHKCIRRFFYEKEIPHEILRKHFKWTRHALHELLLDRRSLWEDLTPSCADYLKFCYPDLPIPIHEEPSFQRRPRKSGILIHF